MNISRGDFLSLVLCAVLCLLLSAVSFGGQIGGRQYVSVKITAGNGPVCFTALMDTGNTLHDPVSGEPALVVSPDIAARLTGLTVEQLEKPLETLVCPPVKGLRLIPYRAIGSTGGFLLAKRYSDVQIGQNRRSALVAFAPEGLGSGEIHQALTGGIL